MELNGSRRVASLCARTSWRKTRVPVLALEALLILMFSAGATSSGEPCPKHCSCSQRQVWCNSQGFNAVPANLPRNTKKLYLFDNNITVIPPGSLSRLKVSCDIEFCEWTQFEAVLLPQQHTVRALFSESQRMFNFPSCTNFDYDS